MPFPLALCRLALPLSRLNGCLEVVNESVNDKFFGDDGLNFVTQEELVGKLGLGAKTKTFLLLLQHCGPPRLFEPEPPLSPPVGATWVVPPPRRSPPRMDVRGYGWLHTLGREGQASSHGLGRATDSSRGPHPKPLCNTRCSHSVPDESPACTALPTALPTSLPTALPTALPLTPRPASGRPQHAGRCALQRLHVRRAERAPRCRARRLQGHDIVTTPRPLET